MKTKICPRCKVEKSLNEFPQNAGRPHGINAYCCICDKQYHRKLYKQNRDSILQRQKQWRKDNPDKQWGYQLNANHGEGAVELYNKLFQRQNGRCAICGKHQSELPNKLALDHNHTTQQNRGLICKSCNLAIGKLNDSPKLIYQAYLYLQKYEVVKE